MFSELGHLFLSAKGRVSRFTFWLASLSLALAFAVLFVFLESAFNRGSTLLLYPFLLWGLLVLSIKRMHDRGRSSLWLVLVLIPILGPLWLFIELGLRVGTPGENQYGADPLEGGDYLTVK